MKLVNFPPRDPGSSGSAWSIFDQKLISSSVEVANQLCSQFLAIEGQAFVLVATQVLTEGNLEKLNLVDSGVCQTVSRTISLRTLD